MRGDLRAEFVEGFAELRVVQLWFPGEGFFDSFADEVEIGFNALVLEVLTEIDAEGVADAVFGVRKWSVVRCS